MAKTIKPYTDEVIKFYEELGEKKKKAYMKLRPGLERNQLKLSSENCFIIAEKLREAGEKKRQEKL